jgi:hypothetical protein
MDRNNPNLRPFVRDHALVRAKSADTEQFVSGDEIPANRDRGGATADLQVATVRLHGSGDVIRPSQLSRSDADIRNGS